MLCNRRSFITGTIALGVSCQAASVPAQSTFQPAPSTFKWECTI